MNPPEPRRPQVFAPDDPALIDEEMPVFNLPPASDSGRPSPDEVVRPTLSGVGARGLRWGAVLLAALTGAALLGIAIWFYRLVGVALAREDWIGWTTFGLLVLAAVAAVMLCLRELIGFARLARLSHLRVEIGTAIASADVRGERKAVGRLCGLYVARPELAWNLRRFREHARDVHDTGQLLTLAEREIVTPLDLEARRLIMRASKRVATITALSPMVVIAVVYVLIENVRLLRMLAALYGGRPGIFGALRLAHMVFAHILATGGIAMTDDLLGQFLGQDILRRLSRRLGEGAFNGALTARIGVAAVDVIRPLPFLAARPLRVRDVLGEVLKPLFTPRRTKP